MKINEARAIIRKEVSRKGYRLEERKSTSTNSWYFKIYSGDCSLLFRLSDHFTKSDVITLRTDKKLSIKSVTGFIDNRCHDLSVRKVKTVLGM